MAWLHVAVWFLAAVSAYIVLDVLDGQVGQERRGTMARERLGAGRPLTLGFSSASLVAWGACLPMGAAACLLLGAGLGGAVYALLPILGMDAQPAWVRPSSRDRARRRS